MSAISDVTDDVLRELTALEAEHDTTLSIYVDLDPAEFAIQPARASEITALLDQAARQVESGERPHEEKQALRAAVEHVRDELRSDTSWAREARAVALFADETLGLWRVLKLADRVRSCVNIGRAPAIGQLVRHVNGEAVCVAVIDERNARILHGSKERLREIDLRQDSVHGRHAQGGWSQANYQRSRENDVKAHIRAAIEDLRRHLRRIPFDRLLIATTEPLWEPIRADLPAELRQRLVEQRLRIDSSDATEASIATASAKLLDATRTEHEDELLETLRGRLGRPDSAQAAAELGPVLEVLHERRVETLLYDTGFSAPGVRCPQCEWLGTDGEVCPMDGHRLQQVGDIVEPAIHAAVQQSAAVVALDDRPELGPLGHIAALLRF